MSRFAAAALAAPDAAPADAAPADAAPVADAPADAAPAAPEAPAEPTAQARVEPEPEPAEPEAARVHLTLRGGQRIFPDDAAYAITADHAAGNAEIGFDVTVFDHLAIGLAYQGGGAIGKLYRRGTQFTQQTVALSAVYRVELHPQFDVYGRLGPTVNWYQLELGESVSDGLHADGWSFGARAALGFECWVFSRYWLPFESDFALGFAGEVGYDFTPFDDWRDDGVDPGAFDPSALTWLVGVVVRF